MMVLARKMALVHRAWSGWSVGAAGLGVLMLAAGTQAHAQAWLTAGLHPALVLAQEPATPPAATQTAPPAEVDPLNRPLSDKQKIRRRKELGNELSTAYKTWLNQDVAWIISDEEARAFKNLSNDEERDNFIEAFWQRRNPNPDSPDNEYKEEHYRRIAYANEHFAAGKPGWKTDRGHIYISFGKPDSIDQHPSGGSYNRPM